ncbi:hypothetical protein GGR57DRAFT_510872 [Xylariaceae sp. FL1272]|nr:hypothetical protein GGR57DRAFT_510872 [Xylariaceae sp. FL1272]
MSDQPPPSSELEHVRLPACTQPRYTDRPVNSGDSPAEAREHEAKQTAALCFVCVFSALHPALGFWAFGRYFGDENVGYFVAAACFIFPVLLYLGHASPNASTKQRPVKSDSGEKWSECVRPGPVMADERRRGERIVAALARVQANIDENGPQEEQNRFERVIEILKN